MDLKLGKESFPGRYMSPLGQRVPRKTHGKLCTIAGVALSFSAASENSVSNGQIHGGQLKGSHSNNWASSGSLFVHAGIRLPSPTRRYQGNRCHWQERPHQNNCSCGLETYFHHPYTSWMSREISSRALSCHRQHISWEVLSVPKRQGDSALTSVCQKASSHLQSWDSPPLPDLVSRPVKHILPSQTPPAKTSNTR